MTVYRVRVHLFHAEAWTEHKQRGGQADMVLLTIAFRNFVNATNKKFGS